MSDDPRNSSADWMDRVRKGASIVAHPDTIADVFRPTTPLELQWLFIVARLEKRLIPNEWMEPGTLIAFNAKVPTPEVGAAERALVEYSMKQAYRAIRGTWLYQGDT